MGLLLDEDLQRINAAKNVLAGLVNLVAALVFIAVTDVAWLAAGLIALGSVVGGQLGAQVGRRVPPPCCAASSCWSAWSRSSQIVLGLREALMGTVRRVTAADDARLGDYVGLTDVALRSRREPAEGLFIAEGEKVIRRALDAGYRDALDAARGEVAARAGRRRRRGRRPGATSPSWPCSSR